MEELFTAQDPEQTSIFVSALYQATQEGALRVIGTIRSDHLHHCHRHPDLVTILRGRGHYPLGTSRTLHDSGHDHQTRSSRRV